MNDKIIKFIEETRHNNHREKIADNEIKTFIDDYLQRYQLSTKLSFSEKLYIVAFGITIYPQCKCGNTLVFKSLNVGYSSFCNDKKCVYRNTVATDTMKKTNLIRYGTPASSQATEVKEKRTRTFIERYGVTAPMLSKEIQQKTHNTNIERYGVSTTLKDGEIREKIKETNIERYGYDNPFKSPRIQNRVKETNIERYGSKSPLSNEDIKRKIIDTNINRYGTEIPMRSDIIKGKLKKTMQERYGCDNISQKNIAPGSIMILHDRRELLDLYHKYRNTSIVADYLRVSRDTVVEYLHYHNIDLIFDKTSTFHAEIMMFLDSLGIVYQKNVRTIIDKELDIYIPQYNLAIECNGSYWHSELHGKDKNYHLQKSMACKEKGIHLMHIWEHQWYTKQSIVKSRIGSLVSKNTRIYARQCNIREISSAEERLFLNNTHIQGACMSSVRLGIFYESKLIGVMTFGISRFDKTIDWELLRFSTELGVNIIGGASKLFKHFIRNYSPSTIISYADFSLNRGTVYSQIGFNFSHQSGPAYYYTKDYKVFENRVKYQKHKLSKLLKIFDESLTEWENMKNNGYDRIWDCGNLVFIWQR